MNAVIEAWPHQDYGVSEACRLILEGYKKICLTSPTGGGKSLMICRIIEWAVEQGFLVVLYTNRKLLIDQLRRVLDGHGIRFGVRAAGHADERELPVQISSLPTERARVIKTERWFVHGHGKRVLAIVDEAHLNSSDTAQQILAKHLEHDGAYVGVTATPIDLGHLYDTLVVAGTPSELRKCGAIVPAYHYGPDEPDMSSFKQSVKTGEYTEGDVRKAIMTKCIFARVIDNYSQINPDKRPTILFAPGVKESIWFAEQLCNVGVRAAHIDGGGVWADGEYRRGGDREELLRAIKNGDVQVLCNRFVLREGIDLPDVSHIILATVMGALRTYLQSVGRGGRANPGKTRFTVQDHGGHWHRHGSVNSDRVWDLNHSENMVNGVRLDNLREKKITEPIMCPQCKMVRASGVVCPNCGHEAQKKSRMVIQHDGTLREHTGDIYKPRRTAMKNNTVHLWTQAYYRAKNSKNHMTFRQAEGLFFYENHYWPPHDLPFMPANKMDWFLPVRDVPKERLQS